MPGDECAIFMPYSMENDINQAKILYKRIRNRIDRAIEIREYDIFFTISAGVAEFDTEKDSFNELLKMPNLLFMLPNSMVRTDVKYLLKLIIQSI